MTGRDRLLAALSPDLVEAIEQLVAERVHEELAATPPHTETATPSPYMTVREAAAYLRCSRQRVDDLLSQRRLTRHKDGRRTLISRTELETHLHHHPHR